MDHKENSQGNGFGLVCGDCRHNPCQCLPVPSVAKIWFVVFCILSVVFIIYCWSGNWIDLKNCK